MEDATEDVFFFYVSVTYAFLFIVFYVIRIHLHSQLITCGLQAILELVLSSLQGLIVASCNCNHLSSEELSH